MRDIDATRIETDATERTALWNAVRAAATMLRRACPQASSTRAMKQARRRIIERCIGIRGAEHTGKPGDGGVDATGELNVANLAKVRVYVQVKRYKLGTTIATKEVKALRQSIPSGGQGAFITTADFQKAASDVALESGFPRIGLVNGQQLVDLLVEHWSDIPVDFQNKLGLKPGLVRT